MQIILAFILLALAKMLIFVNMFQKLFQRLNMQWLIVGLGNPGERYHNTRHNIGWLVADEFAKRRKINIEPVSSIYNFAEFKFAGKTAGIVKPTTYMNASGEAVRKLANKYSIPVQNIIVIVDEYNFNVGKVHLKKDGGDGGHNGILSIIEEVQATNFLRLRCGIGKDFEPGGMVEYVLSTFKESESESLNLMLSKACDAIEFIIKNNNIGRSMSAINSETIWKPKEEKQEKLEKKEVTKTEETAEEK